MILPAILDWVSLILRWLHVIAGIAWIGSSFYFIALDASLKPDPRLDSRVKGEAWQVHGGGFYQMQKFVIAPEYLPRELVWFKWEAYFTWIFGFALLVVTYYLNPSLYLIDPSVAALSPVEAVAIGAGSLAVGWLVYDGLCRSPIGREPVRLALVGFALLVAATFFYTRVFSGRGAFIHVGALVGTIMVANVFLVIIPNQRKIVADMVAGREPPAHLGLAGKQRSVHNNYLTLPVVFTMISNHYAFTYQSRWSWLLLAAVFVGSFLIRHWFNVKHTGQKPGWWLWPAGAAPIAVAALLTIMFQQTAQVASATPVSFAQVHRIIGERCEVCHSSHPRFPGFAEAPMGIMFDSPAEIVAHAPQIYAQAVAAHAMPLGNATHITDAERATIGAWISAGAKVK